MKKKKAIFRWLILAISVLFLLIFLNSSKETSVIKQLGAKIFKTKAENSTEDITIPRLNINGDGILDLATKATTLDVTAQFEGSDEVYYATLKLQGTSSLSYEKKNYTINFYKDETYSSKKKIDLGYGWGKESKYCLKANWIDSTQARNIVSARLAAQMQKKYGLFEDTPNNGLIDGHFVEIYINGEYRGLYTLNIPKDDWMFNMNKNNENHIVMCAENPNKGSSTTFEATSSTVDGEDWSIEVGPNGSDEEVQATFAKLNRVINFVKDSTNEEFKAHFSEYLNLDATLNYYCFMALSNAVDNMNKNMLFVTYDGQVWYPSLYDLDTTWGLWFNGEGLYSFTNKVTDYGGGSSLLFKKLVECYPNELQARYTELRETVLSNENIINEFEKFINSAPAEAWEREQTKWPNIPSKQYGIDQIKEHVLKRGNYIDSVMEQLVIESKTYEDSRILYQLDKEYIGGPYKFLDTGINLYNDETNPDGQDYTIFARFKSNNLEGFETIFAQRDQLRNGIVAQTSDDNDSYTVFYAGNSQYEALFGDNGSYTSVAIKKEGSQYYIYRDNINNVRIRPNDTEDKENFTVDSPIVSDLILGASYYYDSANNIITEGHYNGIISNFVVYNIALSEDEISTKLTELSNIRSSLTDVKYEGDVKSTFAPGQNFNVGNAKFTAIYEDGTTLDVTNNLVFTPKKITKDTSEVKVSYTENTVTKEFIFPITVKEYLDNRILYELEKEFVGDGQSYINTGVSLYENGDAQNYTVLVRYRVGEASTTGTPFSDTKEVVNKGINIFVPNDGTWSGIYAGNANYEALYGDSKNKYAVAIVKKEGTNYYYYLDNVTNTRTLADKPIDSAFSEEAIIGAVRNTATTMTDYFVGTVSNCIIYNEALSTEEITALMEEYTSLSNSKLSKIELTASPEVKQYAEGSKFKTTGMTITATYEDQTTKDVTSKITVEPEVLTLDTTEVTVIYEENKISKTLTIPVKVIKYEDSRILYELEEEFVGDGQSYINTGVSLYENGDDQNYTVLVRYKIGESSADTTPFSDTKDSINKGIDIFIPSDGTWSGIYAGNANYESLYGDSKSKYAVAIIKKEGTNYYYYLDNVTNTRTLTDKPIDSAFSEEAIIGAVRNTATTMTNYFTGTVSNCIIYNEALSTEEITALMEEYISLSNSKLSKIELTASPEVKQYAEGSKFKTTGMTITATYEDQTTKDVTSKITVEPEVLTLDTTEVTVIYEENKISKTLTIPVKVIKYEDSRILYELEEEFVGDGQSYINTGVSLYENGDDQNYTVLVRYKIGESSADTTPFSDTKDSINKGIDIFIPSDGTWSGIYAGNANYESLYGDSKSKYAVAIIKKEGTNYYYYLDNVTNTRTLTDKPIDSAFSEEAIIGAVRNTTTTMTNYFTGTVSNCIIYNEALSTEEITTLMEEYTSLSNSKLSKIEISTLPTKTKYFSGDKLDLTGLKVIATYEDGSTEDVTDKIEVENAVISKDVTEIKLLYTENRITKETSYPITVVMAEKYIKNASVSKRITGTAPFDVDNRAGNDSSADNRIIRSFDKIEYSVRLEFSVNDDQNFDDGNIYIHAELPEDCANVAKWDIEETAWITSSNATLSEDGRILDAIYEMKNKQNTQGIQNLTFIIEVLGAKNGTEFKPSFKFWLSGNQTDPTNPDYNVCEMTPSENVLVSSKPAYNFALTQNPVLSAKTTVELDGKQQSGRMYGYSLILQLYNNDEAKGLKGIEIPKGDVTFDINMLMSKIKDSIETDITDIITPILWNYKINTITETGKIADRSMKINGIEYTDFGYTSAPLGEYGDIQPEESVYNSGDINITQAENKLSVTISDYIIKNIFPKSGYFSGTHLYPNNVGCFSAGYVQIFVKDDDELTDENSEYYLTLQAQNIKFTSLSDKSITVQTNTDDDEIKTRYYYLKPGDYSNWLALTKKDTDGVLTPNAAMQGGYSLRDEGFAVSWFIKLNETNDDEANINSADGLLKFDADAIIPTGTMNYTSTSNTSDMKFKLYYATKKDGTNWNNQTEMINSNFDDLNYYDSIDKIPSNEVCVAIYVESYDGHLKQGDSILKFGFKTSTQATIGKTYVITKDLYMYKDKLDRTIYTRTSPTENYPEATYQQANETFIPGSYDEEGNLTEGTGSYVGQTLLIIGANQSAPISVKEDEAGNIKTVYNLGKNENIVKFKITPSITNTKTEEIGTTTLTITSYLPEGLEYVEGSTNYENVKVENVTRNGSTYTKLTWNIYEAKVNQSLDEITYEARISNKTANNKKYTVESSIIGDSDVIGNIVKNEREYSTTISIVNLEAHVFYKETDTSVVERNSQIHYILSYKNNTSEDVNDFRILDILPYNGDNRGSSFSGSYIVDKISVTTNSSQNINIYVSNDENARNIESISGEDLSGSNWSKLTSETNGTYSLNSNETAIMVDGGIDADSDILVDVYITPTGNESGDKYVNIAKTSVENLTSSSATSVVVYRKISGVVWFDKNSNGIMDSDEERMPNVKLSLLKSSNEKAVDAYGNEVLDTYTDEKGCYSFEKLSKGEYIVVITLNDEYELTLKEVGTNNSINSKFNTTNNTSNTITRLNYLNDAVLNEENINAGVVFATKIKVIEVNEKHPELRPDVKVYLGQKDALGNLNNIESIVLNSSNDYAYTWNNLAKYSDDGTEIEYVVTQDVPSNYYQYSLTRNENTFTIINYKLGQIKIITEDNDGNRLEGATFVLKNSNDEIIETLVTSSSGIITYSSLKCDEYILTETVAPQGYSLQKSNLSIVIDEDNIDYVATIKHSLKTILPNTGKFDTIYMIILQIVLMGGGIKFLSVNKHKKVPKHKINKRRR